MDQPISGYLPRMLEELRSFTRETTQTDAEGSLDARVMELFRAENLEGLSALMTEQRMVAEFRDELHALLDRWTVRLYGQNRAARAFDKTGGEAR